MFPKHKGAESWTGPSPFKIKLNKYVYSPGDEIEVSLTADDGRFFTGVQIRAHRLKGDTEEIQGTFTNFPTEKLKSFDCIGGKKNLLGHKNGDPVTDIELIWKAPNTNEGDLVFTATFVEDFSTFWANINVELSTSIPFDPPPVRQVSVAESNFDFEACGKTMGCVLYPFYCKGEDCDVGLTYQTENDEVTFQMFARGEGYVSVGFSDDQLMGNDQTISCTAENDRVTIQHGRNPKLYNERQYTENQIWNMRTMHKDGMLYCSFTRPKRMRLVNANFPNKTQYFDLNDDYYVMVAWGYTYKGTDVMGKHKELPITTHSKVNFDTYEIYRAGALPLMTKIHAFLMLLAWMVFAGLAAIISRYYKKSFGGNLILGAALWFQSHRLTALLAFGFCAASFVLIFIKVFKFTNDAVLHAWFGMAVMVTTTGQVFAGLIRPGPKSKIRPIFNWGHWFFGKTLQLLSVITCFLAFNSKFIPEPQKLFGTIVISAWLGLQIIWEVFYEIRKCRQKSKYLGFISMLMRIWCIEILY
ncbi:hypothetical protein FSP39_005869 [Pinctada imbricata]|uniref:Ferric-chelate reductase 1 n=1 Tax=Pinctada imbricata TaxID=66713 RepID=A0AA88YDY5_PINIB|nr:hypothetical protein FSP39_005869 [Pinctada imbricata]